MSEYIFQVALKRGGFKFVSLDLIFLIPQKPGIWTKLLQSNSLKKKEHYYLYNTESRTASHYIVHTVYTVWQGGYMARKRLMIGAHFQRGQEWGRTATQSSDTTAKKRQNIDLLVHDFIADATDDLFHSEAGIETRLSLCSSCSNIGRRNKSIWDSSYAPILTVGPL